MQIRRAAHEDIPQIIELLKVSLGESLMPKTEAFWRWKHIENPFGESMVLLAEEKNGHIIGVRAFMNWEWNLGGKIYKAVRAVDTATHPDHQGKGIFKKLTLAGLDVVKTLGVQFVYNTPNNQSKPGYLKMGWKEQGRMSLKLKLSPWAYKREAPLENTNWDKFSINDNFYPAASTILTNYSTSYLTWRYKDNPMFDYHFITDNESYFLIYRYKQHSFGAELRVTDFLINHSTFDGNKRKHLMENFKSISNKVFLTSVSGNHYRLMQKYYPAISIIPVLNKGPMVTIRNVQLEPEDFDVLLDTKTWSYTLGDLELF